MTAQDVFLAITGISLTLVGFSSLITALRRPREQAWAQQEIIGLVMLGMMSLGALIFSLMPFPLYYMGLPEPQVWGIATVVYLVYVLGIGVGLAWVARRHGHPSRRRRVFNIFAVLSAALVALMVLNLLGMLELNPAGVYLLGVVWLIVIASVQFLVFLTFAGKV
jgi:hypothetical protein